MSALDQLACSLGRRDEVPNQELARELAASGDEDSIREVVEALTHQDPAVRADCIKVLYEVGYVRPELIAPYAHEFINLLRSRENRLVWGGMIALSTIAPLTAYELHAHLDIIMKAFRAGSVITRDAGVLVLAGIAAAREEYNKEIFPFLLDHLRSCRPKDVPQHCEKILLAVNADNKAEFIALLEKRLEVLSGRQVIRVEEVISQAAEK